AKHTLTVYLLDSKAKDPVTTAAPDATINVVVAGKPSQHKLPAAPLMGEPMGQSSCFSLTDQPLCEALDDPANKARLSVTIGAKPYTADIEGHDHEHEKK